MHIFFCRALCHPCHSYISYIINSRCFLYLISNFLFTLFFLLWNAQQLKNGSFIRAGGGISWWMDDEGVSEKMMHYLNWWACVHYCGKVIYVKFRIHVCIVKQKLNMSSFKMHEILVNSKEQEKNGRYSVMEKNPLFLICMPVYSLQSTFYRIAYGNFSSIARITMILLSVEQMFPFRLWAIWAIIGIGILIHTFVRRMLNIQQ